MPKEVNLFTYCGSSQMKEKLWRDMFIAHIFGVDMPEDIEVRRLSDIIKRGISGKRNWHLPRIKNQIRFQRK